MRDAIAKQLPMKLNKEMTAATIVAAGPRLAMVTIWHFKRNDLDSMIVANYQTRIEAEVAMQQMTRNAVCSDRVMGAFVRLGGQIQYIYKTDDQFVVFAPLVNKCEPG